MRRFGQILMALGVSVGTAVAVAMGAQLGWPGAPWLVNVALAKLGLVAAIGLLAGGAASVRLARRHERRELGGSSLPAAVVADAVDESGSRSSRPQPNER